MGDFNPRAALLEPRAQSPLRTVEDHREVHANPPYELHSLVSQGKEEEATEADESLGEDTSLWRGAAPGRIVVVVLMFIIFMVRLTASVR